MKSTPAMMVRRNPITVLVEWQAVGTVERLCQ